MSKLTTLFKPPMPPWYGDFGFRKDGRPKGRGWLGVLRRPNGGISSEISVGVQINGQETEIPLIVPTLDHAEIQHLLTVNPDSPDFFHTLPPTILQKAIEHARTRIHQNLSPFAD